MGCSPSCSRPEFLTLFKLFISCVAKFSSVVALFDGLDELTDIIPLLAQIRTLPIKVFVTTRPHLAHVEQQLGEASKLTISAQNADVEKYVKERVNTEKKIVPRLRVRIQDKVVGQAKGMCVLKGI